ncbi:MAG: hypothetical protein IT375_15970 [Polyangiaceae bacterium]|mgnify:CR=1 FL=1|nr:hypothetical protein [Polyangiaceae bacterium]
MTDPKDLDAIDEGWGEDPEPAKPESVKPEPAKPAPKPVPKVQLKHLGKPAPAPLAAPAEPPPDDDDIEFEADAVARDSMPTFQHPNPLQFDLPDSPRVPKPPPLPKFRRKR